MTAAGVGAVRFATRRISPRSVPGNSASERIARSFSFAIGLGGVLYGLLLAPEMLHQGRYLAAWWTPVAMLLMFGSCLQLAGTAIAAPPVRVRQAAATLAWTYLLILALSLFAVHRAAIPGPTTWQYRMACLGTMAAALAWTTRPATVYLLLGPAGAAAVNLYCQREPTLLAFAEDFSRVFTVAALLALCGNSALRAGATLDRETGVAKRQAAAVAAADAEDRERARFAALIHDGVLSTLLDASRGHDAAVLRRQALRTLRRLDGFRTDTAPAARRRATVAPESLDAAETIGLLRDAVAAVNRKVGFTAHRRPDDALGIPSDAANTMAEALTEAVRNSLRHAEVPGREVHRTVTATVDAGGIRVVLADDGAGFDVSSVPAHRLGVAVSILGRMSRLAGGACRLDSTPGCGTTVTLTWSGGAAPVPTGAQ